MLNSAWAQSIISGLLGAFLAGLVSIYVYYRQTSQDIQQYQISLSRELAREFYSENIYKDLRIAIESCRPLYRSWGGSFSNDQVNRYLGFFDDLGLYLRKDALTVDLISHFFGAYIIEAFEHQEIRKYIAQLRSSMEHPDAFVEFEHVASRLEKDPKSQRQVEEARRACRNR